MAITVDAQVFSSSDASDTTLTFAHTCSGSNRLLVVTVPESRSQTATVTYNGVAMTSAVAQSNSTTWARIFYLIAPATGSNNVVITYSSALTFRQAGAISFNGVDQTSPLGATNAIFGTIQNKSIGITTTEDNSVLVDSLAVNSSNQTPTAGQTLIGAQSIGLNRVGAYEIVGSAGAYSQTYSAPISEDYSMVVAEFKEAVNAVNNGAFLLMF